MISKSLNRSSRIRLAHLVIAGLCAVGSISGGIALWLTNGLGMSMENLSGSWFDSYRIPGLILLLVVGGSFMTAFFAVLQRRDHVPYATATAGFALVIWIFVETLIIPERHWLQPAFFALGLTMLILTMVGLRDQPIRTTP